MQYEFLWRIWRTLMVKFSRSV